jgi:hypothetical protein
MVNRIGLVGLLCVSTLACRSTEMRVTFPGFPQAVQGVGPDDCKLSSRSPREHLLRVSLSARRDGREVLVEGEVPVSITNLEHSPVIGRAKLKADGQAVELVLDGPAKTGEHLALRGEYTLGGERHEFEQRCHVD